MYDEKYSRKAMLYDLLANYYKYTNPQLHVMYYHKHLKYMNKLLISQYRVKQKPSENAPLVRIFNASPEAPSSDVYINGKRMIRNLVYKQETDYLELSEPGQLRVDIYPAGQKDKPIATTTFTFNAREHYTVALVGKLQNLELLLFHDDHEVPAGETKLRIIHLSPEAGALDFAAKSGDVVFPNVTYKEITNYLGLSPMSVNLEARYAGTKQEAFEIPPLRLRPNRAYTIYITGLVSSQPQLEALIVQD